jgi:hypothetical protein
VDVVVPAGSTATYYLVARCNYTPGSVSAFGHIAVLRLG